MLAECEQKVEMILEFPKVPVQPSHPVIHRQKKHSPSYKYICRYIIFIS